MIASSCHLQHSLNSLFVGFLREGCSREGVTGESFSDSGRVDWGTLGNIRED